ncbi:hypothetical protein ZIOFF_068116 [Zingiber officinale]|uniref:Uncharacterized protein n=1 Tax=Zingiber officinale TaxID=94328 RepID=A0A8J5C7I9_ZINOF|nr:hypothetical protein ZIOFF_068116 [Zingiber officinale]
MGHQAYEGTSELRRYGVGVPRRRGCQGVGVSKRRGHSQVTIERDLVSQAEEEDIEALLGTYVMGIGEAEAFLERLKRELLALEAENVHALIECESIIEEDKAPYVAKAAKLKTEYTKKLAMYNKNQTLSVVLEF